MDNNNVSTIMPKKLPSFVNYSGIHFDYNGKLEVFHERFNEVTNKLGNYTKYKANTFSYEVICYHKNREIKYIIDIFENRKGEVYTIESRRLNNCSGFDYHKKIYNLWINLNNYGLVFDETFIKYKENSNLKNRIPNLPIQTSDNNKLDYKNMDWGDKSGCNLFEEVKEDGAKEKELISIKNQLDSIHVDDIEHGLYRLIGIINYSEFTDYLKKSKLIIQVLNKFCNLNSEFPNRLFLVFIREIIDSYHEEIMKDNLILDYIYTKLNNLINNDIMNKMLYLYEVQLQSLLILKKLYNFNNGIYKKVLKEKNYNEILSKLIKVTDQEIIKRIAIDVFELLK